MGAPNCSIRAIASHGGDRLTRRSESIALATRASVLSSAASGQPLLERRVGLAQNASSASSPKRSRREAKRKRWTAMSPATSLTS